jgi:hypothetical protein
MATINGSLTIQAKSTVTARSKQIWAGFATIRGKSNLTAKGNGILSGATVIGSSSKLSIFWLKMSARSNSTIGTPKRNGGCKLQRNRHYISSGSGNFWGYLIGSHNHHNHAAKQSLFI